MAFVRQSAERFDQADAARLAELSSRWEQVSADVSGVGRRAEVFHGRWRDFRQRTDAAGQSLDELALKLKGLGEIGHEASVRFALKECDTTAKQLEAKEALLRSLETDAEQLVLGSQQASPQCIRQPLRDLWEQLGQLTSQLAQVKAKLLGAQSQWEAQRRAQLQAMHVLAECEYLLERHSLASGDLATFVPTIERLFALRDRLASAKELEELQRCSEALQRVCEPLTARSVGSGLADVQARWASNREAAESRASLLAGAADEWKAYAQFHADCGLWLDGMERQVTELMDSEIPLDDTVLVSRCRVVQSDLDTFGGKLRRLSQLSDSLSKVMDSATLATLASGQTLLAQRQRSLKSMLHKFVQEVGRASARRRQFRDLQSAVEAFLDTAEAELRLEDPDGERDPVENIRYRLCELLGLADMFSQRQYQLDRLADMAARGDADDEEAASVRQLTQSWQRLLAQCLQRAKQLQAGLTLRETFVEKCNEWRRFLDRAEADLSAKVAGNESALQQQQASFDSFLQSLASRQQVLDSLLSEGKELARCCADSEQRQRLAEKLDTLQRQWEAVVQQARQRKAIVDANLAQWRGHALLRDKLLSWLNDLEDRLVLCNFSVASVQKIRILAEQARVYHAELRDQEAFYAKCREQAQLLAELADADVAGRLRSELAGLEAKWMSAVANLERQRDRLEAYVRLWTDVDSSVEECLRWLKEVRQFAQRDIPGSFDAMQADANECRKVQLDQLYDYLKTFESTGSERSRLHQLETQLCEVIGADDIHLLRQRTLLLDKQWDELHHRLRLKEEQLKHNINEWRDFNDKYKRMLDWIASMEEKIHVSQDYQVEDLIEKISNDYAAEINSMRSPYEETAQCGQRLLAVSSAVRSEDIEFKLQRLAERWQALEAAAEARLQRLQETLQCVRQLEASMQTLRAWLAVAESQLEAPSSYQCCDFAEIQRLTHKHQQLQSDVESRTSGVQAVISLCELLVYERDACPTDRERRAVQRAMRSLDRRWRRICQLAMERRLEIEDTWRSWQRMKEAAQLADSALSGVESALADAGGEADAGACSELQLRLQSLAKELSAMDEDYRQLAKLGRTDSGGRLRQQLDSLKRRHAAAAGRLRLAARRLRHSRGLDESVQRLRRQLLAGLRQLRLLRRPAGGARPQLEAQLQAQLAKLDYMDRAGRFVLASSESAEAAAFETELRHFGQRSDQLLAELRAAAGSDEGCDDGDGDGDEQRLSGDGADFEDELDELAPREPGAAEFEEDDELQLDDADSVHSDATDELLAARPALPYRRAVGAQLTGDAEADAKLERVERLVDSLERLLEEAEHDLEFSERRMSDGADVDCQSRLLDECRAKIDRIRSLEARVREAASISSGLGSSSRVSRLAQRWQRLAAEAEQRAVRSLATRGSASELAAEAGEQEAWLTEALRRLRDDQLAPADEADLAAIEESARRLQELVGQLEQRKAALTSLRLCANREDLSEAQRGRLADCASAWRAAYAEARRRHLRLQTCFANCPALAERLAELAQGVAEGRQLALDCRPLLADQLPELASKEATAAAAEARVAEAAEQVRKWAGYAGVVAGCCGGQAASAELASAAGELKRLDVEMAELLRRLRATKRELALRRAAHEPLGLAAASAAHRDNTDDTPAADGRRRGSILQALYRGMVLSLPIEAFLLLLCGIGFLLRPDCEGDCVEQPGLLSVTLPQGANF